LTAQAGANAPASADVSLGSVNMPYRARATAPWMTVTPDSGDRLETLHVNVNASGLKPATYDGQIEIAPADASKFKLANATIPVHLAVKAEPVSLRLQPQTLQFEYRDGGPMPRPKQVAVDPNLMPSLQTHWENPKEANWARVDRKSDGLSIAVQPYKGMTVGTHSATLVVELPGAVNSPQHVAVSLKVSSALGPIKIP
jgi:hypothetical protein